MRRLALMLVSIVLSASSALADVNLYRDALRTELGPQLIRERRWAEVWLMTSTNDFFQRNPKATVHDFQRQYGAALEYLRKGPTALSDDFRVFVNLMREFIPTLPGTGVVTERMLDTALRDHYALLDRTWSLDPRRPSVFQVADTLAEAESCVNTKACRQAYDRILSSAKVADNVDDVVDAFRVKRIKGLPLDPKSVTDDLLRIRITIDKRKGADRGKVTPADKEQLRKLEVAYVEELTNAAREYREQAKLWRTQLSAQEVAARHQRKIDNLRASGYLVSTFVGFIDPVAGQKIGQVSDAVTQIMDAVGRRDISQVMLAANVVQGALTLTSILAEQGPSFEQATLAALREIQQQIAQLRIEIQRGFAGLNWKIDQVYLELANSLENITNSTVTIARGVEDLAIRSRELAALVDQSRADNADSFRNLDKLLLASYADCFSGAAVTDGHFINCRAFLSAILTGLAGASQYVSIEDPATMPPRLPTMRRPLPEIAGYLARYANEHGNLQLDTAWFPHLAIWSRFASTYVAVVQSHPKQATAQTAAIQQDLERIRSTGTRTDAVLRSLGGHQQAIFGDATERYLRAAETMEHAVRRAHIAAVRSTVGGADIPLPGQEYFSDHLVNGQRISANYDLFGTADQNRPNYTASSTQLFACPPGQAPTQSNDSLRPKNLDAIIALNRPLFALYGTNLDIPATTPQRFSQLIPAAVRMYSDLTGRAVGMCVSDVNWTRAAPPLVTGIGDFHSVHLRITLDLFVGNPGPRNFDPSSVFAQINLDTSPIANPIWTFNGGDAAGGHGDHLVHRMHNFIFGSDGKPMMVQPMVDRIDANTPVTVHAAVVASLQQQTAAIMEERRYLYVGALAELLLSKNGRVDWAAFGDSGTSELLRAFDEWQTAYLVIDRYVALLLNDSYSRDREQLATILGGLNPAAYPGLLAMLAKSYECAHPKQGATPPCSVQPDPSGTVNFVAGVPLLVAVRDAAPTQRVFTYTPAKSAIATTLAVINKRFESAKPASYEPIAPFTLATEVVRLEQERRAKKP